MFDLFIATNGPGEIITWVTPLVSALKKHKPNIRITIFIQPCRFSTGREAEIAARIEGVDYVFPVKGYLKRLVNLPFKPYKNGLVMFLGGDLFLALLFKWRYGFKAFAYTEGLVQFRRFYDQFYLRDIDGDLMFSFFQHHKDNQNLTAELQKTKNIVFFPGSRPAQFKYLFPLMQKVASLLPTDYQPYFSISSFIKDELVEKYKLNDQIKTLKGSSIELMKSAEMAVSIPGTNNTQLAYFGVPTLIIFPFNHPEVIHFEGALGAILNFPGLKRIGKRLLLKFLNKKTKYTVTVNQKADMFVFPELRGDLDEKMIGERLSSYINDNESIKRTKDYLKSMNKDSVVLEKIVRAIEELPGVRK